MIKKILRFLFAIVILLLVIIAFNTLRFSSKQEHQLGQRLSLQVDTAAISHLSKAIQIKTISYDEDSPVKTDLNTFDTLINFLRTTYPATFIALGDTVINRHSLVLHWKGNEGGKPVILYAHMDVVPVDESRWNNYPFNGKITSDSIFGRGAIDDKGSVIAIMESIEKLVMSGFNPKRDVYIAFGHDEEAGGEDGAKKIAAYLSQENVHAEFLLDEGGIVAVDMVPFVKPPVALVFTSEKGYLTLTLSANGKGGHSSRPPKDASIEILSAAIRKLNENPFNTQYTESVNDFLNYSGPEMRMPFKAMFANRWLFGPIITGEYEKIPSAAAMIRTTSVATVINAGNKENVVPSVATAKINLRLLPGDDVKSVTEKIIKLIDDKRVEVKVERNFTEASKVSSTSTASFNLIKNTIHKVFPDAVVAPSLLIAQTDSRHFTGVTDNIYRFLPIRMDESTLDGMHGINERVGVKDFMETIMFYEVLFRSF